MATKGMNKQTPAMTRVGVTTGERPSVPGEGESDTAAAPSLFVPQVACIAQEI
jgi:hypothetical protein